MPVPEIVNSFAGSVNRVTLGATKETGGTRSSTVTIGGSTNVVYGGSSSDAGEKPVIAMDVLDTRPANWPDVLGGCYEDALDSPGNWAKKSVEEFGADMICLRFEGIHPDTGDKDGAHAVKVTEPDEVILVETVGLSLLSKIRPLFGVMVIEPKLVVFDANPISPVVAIIEISPFVLCIFPV